MSENSSPEPPREERAVPAILPDGSSQPDVETVPQVEPDSIDHLLEGLDYSHPADIAHLLETLPLRTQVELLLAIDPDVAAEALTELDEHARVEILESMSPEVGGEFLASMSPADAADVLDELDEDHRDEILSSLDTDDAAEIRTLMAYDPETAGGVMNTEVFALEQRLTVDQAIA
ncbi:MAG: magnesium transporter, partial [Deltaproteobacteria bacterium]|nr:magnesium transporter [Deltaproteobacteria bacterium]